MGTVVVLAAATLLTLLWAGAAIARDQGEPGRAWRFVVNRGWAPVTVTICAAAIRMAMSLQAGVAMSMVAAVVVERRHVELADGIFLSIVRAVSIQPVNLFFTGGRSLWKTFGLGGFSLIFTTSLIAIATTFTSSILLADFGNISMLSLPTVSFVGFTNGNINSAVEIWRSPPGGYERFAEYTESGRAVGEHVDDTGLTVRVPLPMAASEERESLRSYTGPATVFDHRVICLAPQLTLLSINQTADGDGGAFGYLSLGGNVSFEANVPLPLLIDPGQPQQIPFNCAFSTRPNRDPWNVTVCSIKQPPGTNSDGNSTLFPLRITPWLNPSATKDFIRRPSIFFILNITAPTSLSGRTWNNFSRTYIQNGTLPKQFAFPPGSVVTSREGPWTTASMQDIAAMDDASFSITACIATTAGLPFNITATSPSDGPEPTLGWSGVLVPDLDQNATQPNPKPIFNYKTTLARRQLNALAPSSSPLSPTERGIMTLSLPLSAPLPARYDQGFFSLLTEFLFPTFPILPANLCPSPGGCKTDPSAIFSPTLGAVRDLGHPVHASLFLDALRETGSPARALQSWITTMTRQRFYDSLPRFTSGSEARYARSAVVFVPARWTGFGVVIGVLVAHLLVVGVVTAWYLRVTRHTMLGNSWLAVAQVVSEATLPVLWRVDGKGDREVKGVIEEEGLGGRKYGVVRLRKTGRRELVAFPGGKG
ncbi:hypothetical protein B0H67DRAFT_556394 [Lasiosphaeris hirsuta]|uniref:Uncharacterized protein n=1 Tax=Lasiosphaeris hirsuta TaxID=260670 RepID=A0AA40DPZ0_9PEZI|nr:hypothetical protein B0H67DRAFT_556394 [Lasiosphaeris hirsuta]